MQTTQKTFEVTTADSPSATTVNVSLIEASSERGAYRQAAETLAASAVVRSVVEVEEGSS
jgi:hypothetical protein